MNIIEFQEKFSNFGWSDKVIISCCCEGCDKISAINKSSAIRNIKKNGVFKCRSCCFSEDGKKKIGQNSSYSRSEDTRKKMSEAKKSFYNTPRGVEYKMLLSKETAAGHAKNKFENSKRQGWYPSTLNGKPVFYGSSYELKLCWLLDRDETVDSYETQIAYEWEERHRCLDFLVTYKNGTRKAIEVKPKDRLNESAFIVQINDSRSHALSKGWLFEVYTEDQLGMTCHQLRVWADELRKTITGIDFASIRINVNKKKAKKHYDTKIATDKVEVWCDYCQETHSPLRLTYEKNIKRNGEYICERKGGSIGGKKPKKKKQNPYAAEGKKLCKSCNEVKLFAEFCSDASRSDGFASRCRSCMAIAAKKRYNRRKESQK